MKQLKKITIFIIASILMIFGLSFIPAPTYAADSTSICEQDGVPKEVKDANGCNGGSSAKFTDVVVKIVSGVIAVLGTVAVVFIVIGGINYMTSQGDPSKTKKAKDTILYAVIGLIICALAFAIVNFVISNIINNSANANSNNSSEVIKGGGPTK